MNPCYKCTDRKAGCHSKCEKYQDWKKESNKKRDAKFVGREYESYISDLIKRR